MSDIDIETTFETTIFEEVATDLTVEDLADEHLAAQVRNTNANIAAAREPERLRREREQQEAAQEVARRVAASGGGRVRTELCGATGEAVAGVLRLDDIGRQAKALRHRVGLENAEQVRLLQREARIEKMDELLGVAWDAAAAKVKVPAILDPLRHWVEHVRPQEHEAGGFDYLTDALDRINAQHANRNSARVGEVLADVDAVIVESAENILTAAGSAADTMIGTGLTPNASKDEVIEHGGAEVIAAFKAWGQAVTAWGDLQSARRWVAVAVEMGFDPERPEHLAEGDHSDIEATVWRSQFEGSQVGVQSAADALVWWTENGRPAPIGVGSTTAGAEQ